MMMWTDIWPKDIWQKMYVNSKSNVSRFIAHFQHVKGKPTFPEHDDIHWNSVLISINSFFITKITHIRHKLHNSRLKVQSSGAQLPNITPHPPTYFLNRDSRMETCFCGPDGKIMKKSSNTFCKNNPLPTKPPKDFLKE